MYECRGDQGWSGTAYVNRGVKVERVKVKGFITWVGVVAETAGTGKFGHLVALIKRSGSEVVVRVAGFLRSTSFDRSYDS